MAKLNQNKNYPLSICLFLASTISSNLVLCQQAPLVVEGISQANQPIQPLASNAVQSPLNQQTLANCTILTTKPTPAIQKYVFKTCILAQFSTYYSIGQGKYIDFGVGKVDEQASLCDNSTTKVEPKLVIEFPCASLSIGVDHTNDSKTFIKNFSGQYQSNGSILTFTNSTPMFYTSQSGHYYKCNKEQAISMNANDSLMISNFALEAYRNVSNNEFYQIPEECLLDSEPVSDLVRIGVGICLIALVAIVLIAYFVGRRRWSERSSYESV